MCHVYSRTELVVYVVGVNEPSTSFAEALSPSAVENLRGYDRDKPFAHMGAKNVLYVERIGNIAVHKDKRPLLARASRRAAVLNMDYADLVKEP